MQNVVSSEDGGVACYNQYVNGARRRWGSEQETEPVLINIKEEEETKTFPLAIYSCPRGAGKNVEFNLERGLSV